MRTFTVSEATHYIKGLFDTDTQLTSLLVRGEISNFKRHTSGHCYFTLKDANATIRAVMFKTRAQTMKFSPTNGMLIVAAGRITIFERDGQYQLYVEQLIPDGIGELNLAYEQLKQRLSIEGLFDAHRKRPIPVIPNAVGIITSSTGAVLRDIVSVAKRRFPSIKLVLFPVQVQGVEAPLQIVHAIEIFNQFKQADVIIVGRGGGSIEELWAFNDENVVRAIANSAIPIISAVGHQTDFTLADFAADVRAATPSQAAELAVPNYQELYKYIKTLQTNLILHISTVLKRNRLSVERYLERRIWQHPQDLLDKQRQVTDLLITRLVQAMQQVFAKKSNALQASASQLAILNPWSVLTRGYGILRTETGEMVRSVTEISLNQKINVLLHDGELTTSIIGIKEDKNYAKNKK